MKKQMAMLIDMNMCSGCFECAGACKKLHGFPGAPEEAKELSEHAYTIVRQERDDFTIRDLCRHCLTPTCVSVCPAGAMEKTDLGPVTYDAEKCMGCRYCMTACPFNVPRYEWDSPAPAIRKCDMCYERQLEGKMPACADACPTGATQFGTREELLAEARERIESCPEDYHPHIYGEFELGGTSVLFLSPFPLESLGYRDELGQQPLKRLTDEALRKIPVVGVAGATVLMAFWWITQRRDEVAEAKAREKRLRAAGETNGKEVDHDRP
jgi:formate dehydrogenase iron-sulfur subunit